MILEANSMSDFDSITVTGDLILNGGAIDILLGFVPAVDDVLSFFNVAGDIMIDSGFGGINAFVVPGSDVEIGTSVSVGIGTEQFQIFAV